MLIDVEVCTQIPARSPPPRWPPGAGCRPRAVPAPR